MQLARAVFLLCLALCACRTPIATRPVGTAAPDPTAPPDDAVRVEQLVLGRKGLREAIAHLETLPLPGSPEPRFVSLPALERALLWRYRDGTPLGPVRSLVVLGVVGWAPAPPDRVAGLWVHPGVMRRVLAARAVTPRGVVVRWPGAARRVLFVEKTGVGVGPLRTDLRFAIAMERVDLTTGDIWVRSDSDPEVPGERVTLWRGLLHAAPFAGGQATRIAEVLIIGTDMQAPPLLEGALREQSLKTLRDSRVNLFRRAAPHMDRARSR